MAFHEETHAFLIGAFYEALRRRFAERGDAALVLATRRYGFERGQRMACRAIRLGLPLDHASFMRLNEIPASGLVRGADGELVSLSPDYEIHITNCPWNDRFRAMGCEAGGALYCANIDMAVSRGFNPAIRFEANGSLNDGPCCVHIVRDVRYAAFPDAPVISRFVPGYDYHCAHLYYAFAGTCRSVFGEEGATVAEEVLARFGREWGEDMRARLEDFAGVDFSACPEGECEA